VEIDAMLAKNKAPYHLKPELTQYFNCLPVIPFHQNWEGLVITVMEYLLDHAHALGIAYLKFDPGVPLAGYIPKQDSSLSLHLIEEIYNNEDALLKAIKTGDTSRALQCIANINHYNVAIIGIDKLRSGKNYLSILNTLARKAAQNGSVHPMHIHAVSSDFCEKIEAAKNIEVLNSLVETMIRRYCSLVREHSLAKFSIAVQNVINYIEFNLKEPLSCNILAKQFNIDPSNLSHHFIREMGISITDFIRKKRLEYAKHLLASSSMYIQEIADECGFDDCNYFCRLFKRQYGQTPRMYRNSLHAGV
jgi:AraC-like DNA-binding protein